MEISMAKTLLFNCVAWWLNLGGNHNFKYVYHWNFHPKWLSVENNTLGKLQPCFQRVFMFFKEHGYSPRKWFSLGQIQPCSDLLLGKLLGCVPWGNNVFSLGNTTIFLEDKCVLKNHFTTMGGDVLKLLLYLK